MSLILADAWQLSLLLLDTLHKVCILRLADLEMAVGPILRWTTAELLKRLISTIAGWRRRIVFFLLPLHDLDLLLAIRPHFYLLYGPPRYFILYS